jgi:hypothetical protein
MQRRAVLAGFSVAVVLCVAACAAAFFVFQQPASGPSFWQTWLLQRDVRGIVLCSPPSQLVPGSYQASPVQSVGQFVVITYSGQCQTPGQPAEYREGYYARSGGTGCGGHGNLPPPPPAVPGDPVTIEATSSFGCGAGTPGQPMLSLTRGQITGTNAVTIEAVYANGAVATAPIQNGHFTVLAAQASVACRLLARDAHGAVLAVQPLTVAPGLGCP